MAPFDISSWGSAAEPVIHILLGMGFGFVLERAGFGSAKKLTNQFYLNDMTVLKVMFTAIITTAVLLLFATTFGVLNYDELWINPTYLGSGIVGGLMFGVGFVVGGYCPGTALVSAATLKLDGLLFVFGVLGGIFVFGYTEPSIDGFFNDSGNFGRWTLHEWLGLPMPVVVLLVVLLALTFFAGGEWVERLVNRQRDAKNPRKFRAAYGLAAALVGTTTLLLLVWPLTNGLRDRAYLAKVETSIAHRQIHVEPRELSDLMSDRRLSLSLIDLRDEASYNRFHLLDARRVNGDISGVAQLPARAVKVLIADDEKTEVTAYRKLALARVENLYVLAGGLPNWTALFDRTALPGEPLAALGGAHPFSRPPLQTAPGAPSYVAKVKRPGMGAKKAGGGCGG